MTSKKIEDEIRPSELRGIAQKAVDELWAEKAKNIPLEVLSVEKRLFN